MKQLELLRRLVSVSATLRAECGAADQTDLYTNYIHLYESRRAKHAPPRATIAPQGWRLERKGLEIDEQWSPELTIELVRSFSDDDTTGLSDQADDIMTVMSAICNEIMEAGEGGVDFLDPTQSYVRLQSIVLADGPYQEGIGESDLPVTDPDSTEQKLVWGATFDLEGY